MFENSILYQRLRCMRSYVSDKKYKKMSVRFNSMTSKDIARKNADLYESIYHKKLDWKNLQTYTEKMQYAKIFDTDPRKALLTDKITVREFVKQKLGEEYLVPLIGVYDNYNDIDFAGLPSKYVIKTNHGSGDAVIVNGKPAKAKRIDMRRKIVTSLNTNYAMGLYEMHYKDITPKIMIEELLGNGSCINDYKFLCFDGNPRYIWVDVDRFSDHKRNVYDLEWNLQAWNQHTYGNAKYEIPKPEKLEEMIEAATILSEGFGHVRVDFYYVDEKIYFSEMTFTNGAGFDAIVPEDADLMLGSMWKLPIDNDMIDTL